MAFLAGISVLNQSQLCRHSCQPWGGRFLTWNHDVQLLACIPQLYWLESPRADASGPWKYLLISLAVFSRGKWFLPGHRLGNSAHFGPRYDVGLEVVAQRSFLMVGRNQPKLCLEIIPSLFNSYVPQYVLVVHVSELKYLLLRLPRLFILDGKNFYSYNVIFQLRFPHGSETSASLDFQQLNRT